MAPSLDDVERDAEQHSAATILGVQLLPDQALWRRQLDACSDEILISKIRGGMDPHLPLERCLEVLVLEAAEASKRAAILERGTWDRLVHFVGIANTEAEELSRNTPWKPMTPLLPGTVLTHQALHRIRDLKRVLDGLTEDVKRERFLRSVAVRQSAQGYSLRLEQMLCARK
jgi:hypothetical protein